MGKTILAIIFSALLLAAAMHVFWVRGGTDTERPEVDTTNDCEGNAVAVRIMALDADTNRAVADTLIRICPTDNSGEYYDVMHPLAKCTTTETGICTLCVRTKYPGPFIVRADHKEYGIFTKKVDRISDANNAVIEMRSAMATLTVVVLDAESNAPVKDAYVYIGGGFPVCKTDATGICMMKDLWRGDYGIGVYKKEYERFEKGVHLDRGENNVVVLLKRKEHVPETITVVGTLKTEIVAPGTRSQNIYIIIQYDDGKKDYVFNEVGFNEGRMFKGYIGKRVRIVGYRDTGFIGWQRWPVEGIYVEKIEEVT